MKRVYLRTYILNGESRSFYRGLEEYLLEENTINDTDGYGFTFLHYAAQHGQFDIVAFLLNYGADVHAKTKKKETPFMLAAENGRIRIMELLRSYNAQINSRDYLGSTALMKAVRHKYKYAVLFLLQHGVFLNEKDKTSNTAISYAASSGQHDLVELLIENGADLTRALECKGPYFVGISFIEQTLKYVKRAQQQVIENKHIMKTYAQSAGFNLGFRTSLKRSCIIIIKDYLFAANEIEFRNGFVQEWNQVRRNCRALLFSPLVTAICEGSRSTTPRPVAPFSPPSEDTEIENIVDVFGACSIS